MIGLSKQTDGTRRAYRNANLADLAARIHCKRGPLDPPKPILRNVPRLAVSHLFGAAARNHDEAIFCRCYNNVDFSDQRQVGDVRAATGHGHIEAGQQR